MENIPLIPWEKFSEEEIHHIIEAALTWDGWETYNLHKIQKSEERGADIIASKDDKKIAIAVKKKPRASDRSQLKDLAYREEDEKIYIYINNPTPKFLEEMENFYLMINFLSKEEFNKWIFEKDPIIFTDLLLFNHSLIYEFVKIQVLLLMLYKERDNDQMKSYKWKKLDEASLRTFWRLKDDTVFINKTLRSFQLMFERLSENDIDIETSINILKSFIGVLNLLDKRCRFVYKHLKGFCEKYKDYVLYVVGKTINRSNWINIATFQPPIHGYLLYDEYKIPKESNCDVPNLNNIIYSLANFCRISANFADSVEDFVDDLFSYEIWDELSTYVFHKDIDEDEGNNDIWLF